MTRALTALVILAATSTPPATHGDTGTFKTTAYCLTGPMRTGEWTHWGAIAVDPTVIPLYTEVTIAGTSRTWIALDTGAGVRGQHIDIWMPDCGDALDWGVRYREVTWSP